MKIWITGAQGLVGRALQHLCQKQQIDFIPTGREVDISSLPLIKDFFHSHPGITHIVNCAAYTRVDDAESHPHDAFKDNVLGPENLGKLARHEGLKIVHLSTDYVFNSETPHPLNETAAHAPSSIYGKTKKEGEERLLTEFPHACIIRTSWVFGSGGKNFISSLQAKLQSDKKVAAVFDQVNRFTYAPDLAAFILSLLCHEGIFHFANHGIVSRYDVAQKMRLMLQEKGHHPSCEEIVKVHSSTFSTPAPRPRFSVLDTQKIEKITGTIPRSWEEALKEYIHEKLP